MKAKPQTYIYFLGAHDVGRVKIGCSRAPLERMEAQLDNSPVQLELLAFTVGTFEDERRLHSIFRHAWSHREWFNMTPELSYLIQFVRSTGHLGSIFEKHTVVLPLPKKQSRVVRQIALRTARAEPQRLAS